MDRITAIESQIEESIQIKRQLHQNVASLLNIADHLIQALRNGNKVLLFGNGGSAADAQHIASELAGKFRYEREPLAAIALNTNVSSMTSIANDYGYDTVFARQLRAIAIKGDVAIGISTSGNSRNVILAIEEAKRIGVITVAFTGQDGKLRDIADHLLAIPSTDTPRIQEAHITAGHIICHLVEEALFGENDI